VNIESGHPASAFVQSDVFASFFIGGFECSTHRRPDGRRLDLIAATGHDRTASADYRLLKQVGVRTFRDGLRWHLIECAPGRYDWSSALASVRAAQEANVQVIWDLMHYGWPDGLDIFADEFVEGFARFSAAAARVIQQESGAVPYYCPINEISYFAWAGGDKARMNPFCTDRGDALKRQLVRASMAAIEAVRAVDSRARIVHAEPLIHVASAQRDEIERAAEMHGWQYQAMDMLTGRLAPELGGRPEYVDILGVNYYPDNQWGVDGNTIPMGHHRYRPLRELIKECHERYDKPIFFSEVGAEGSARAAWLYYVVREVQAARRSGVPVEGLCLYPVLDYPGWLNDRLCETGLLGVLEPDGNRQFDQPLLDELISCAAFLRKGTATHPSFARLRPSSKIS
jgi:beta-glucosidase/6-phospho-beta-glucosidase/beta-galactosidase